jgi:PAS domain S-box-containing protein
MPSILKWLLLPNNTALDPSQSLGENGIAIVQRFSGLLAVVGLVATLNNVNLSSFQWTELTGLTATLVGVGTYWMLTAGHYRGAIGLLIWGSALIVWGTSFSAAGIRTPALVFLPVLCMAAAWLIGVRSALVLGTISLSVLVLHLFAEQAGIVLPTRPRNAASYVLLYFFTFIGAGIVTWGSTRSFIRELERTRGLSDDLNRQVEELCHSEERFSALFRANPVPSSTIDREGHHLDVNDAWIAAYGIPLQDAVGKTAQELGVWTDPLEREAIRHELALRGRVDGGPMRLRTADGALKPFLLYIAPVEFDGQKRLVTSMLDQSDRQAAEDAQRTIHEALEQRVAERTTELTRTVQTLQATQSELVEAEKLASLGSMVAGISHELNTPLGVAVTVASTLKLRAAELHHAVASDQLRRSSLNDFLAQLEDMAELVLSSTSRAAELVRSFKEVAVDRASERRRQFDMRGLVRDIVHAVQSGTHANLIVVTQDVPEGIVCDTLPGPVGQVLTNLIQNALLHAFAEGASGSITIAAKLRGDGSARQVALTVRDDGTGMSEHTRRHAFDPFFTTRLGQGGSGLGLSVSHRVATSLLGGNLTVESTPGAGSCFTFCFLQVLPH